METKKDELFEKVIDDLKQWEDADEAKHRYIFLASRRSGLLSIMSSCSMHEQTFMLGLFVLKSPGAACAVKKCAAHIDRLMQSEPIYQRWKDDKDFSESVKDGVFMHCFRKVVEREGVDLAKFLLKSRDIDSDDNAYNDEE
nr:MAG TPA: hypothetical protein [Caudoviricetes sp.]